MIVYSHSDCLLKFNGQGHPERKERVDSILKSNTDQFSFSRDTLKNLPTCTYDLHIYDANGCFENYTITVGEPAASLSIDSILLGAS